jgi:hypothetical protein
VLGLYERLGYAIVRSHVVARVYDEAGPGSQPYVYDQWILAKDLLASSHA